MKNNKPEYVIQMAEFTVEAIESVKKRAEEAYKAGDKVKHANLMLDMIALKTGLESTTKELVELLKKAA